MINRSEQKNKSEILLTVQENDMLCAILFQISHRHLSLPKVQHVLKKSICQEGEDLDGVPSYAISFQKNIIPVGHQRNLSSHLKQQQQQGCQRVPVSVWFMGLSRHDSPFLWLCSDQSEAGSLQLVTAGCGGSCWWMSYWGQSQQEHYADQLWGAVTGRQTCLRCFNNEDHDISVIFRLKKFTLPSKSLETP